MSNGEPKIDSPQPPTKPPPLRSWPRRMVVRLVWLVAIYLLMAYVVLPLLYRHYEHQPAMADAPKFAITASHIPGDALNVGLIGTEDEVIRAMLAAGWYPADKITLGSSVKIAASVVLRRSYDDAPVSNLYVFGRKQDLAFEQPVGRSAKERHHVRFWESAALNPDGRPMWVGAGTFDASVGLSHRTAQVTHHIDPDIDAERNHVIQTLSTAGELLETYQVTGIGPTIAGHNGGGDWYYTDGEMTVGIISPENATATEPPVERPNPNAIAVKNRFWLWLRGWLKSE